MHNQHWPLPLLLHFYTSIYIEYDYYLCRYHVVVYQCFSIGQWHQYNPVSVMSSSDVHQCFCMPNLTHGMQLESAACKHDLISCNTL